jgi:hypothetical protein
MTEPTKTRLASACPAALMAMSRAMYRTAPRRLPFGRAASVFSFAFRWASGTRDFCLLFAFTPRSVAFCFHILFPLATRNGAHPRQGAPPYKKKAGAGRSFLLFTFYVLRGIAFFWPVL